MSPEAEAAMRQREALAARLWAGGAGLREIGRRLGVTASMASYLRLDGCRRAQGRFGGERATRA